MTSEMYSLLKKLNRDGMTIVVISHDLKSAVLYGRKILHMRRGAIFFGTTDNYVKTGLYRFMSGEGDTHDYQP